MHDLIRLGLRIVRLAGMGGGGSHGVRFEAMISGAESGREFQYKVLLTMGADAIGPYPAIVVYLGFFQDARMMYYIK